MADCASSLVQSDDIYYSGPPLPCIGIEHCDTLTTAVEKIEESICDIIAQISTTTTTYWTEDTTLPEITCPDDVTLYTDGTATSTTFTVVTPAASDNCTASSTLTVTGVRSDGKPLSDPWPLGTTTITWTAADECENISAPCEQTVTVIIGCLTIDAKVYLEGALINPVTSAEYTVPMRTTLNDLQMLPGQAYQDGATIFYTPAGQPYNTEPWNYDGAEGSLFDTGGSVGNAGYPATAVDWVLVSLRDTPGAGYQKICEKAALLLSDGTIVMPESFGCCDIDMTGTYYLVVEHRNHLIVMSHEALPIVNGTLTYDFTTQNSYVLPGSGAVGQKEANGIWFMYGGNGNQSETDNSDTDINADDQSTWEIDNGKQGYRPGDYNMNGDTNSNDQIIWQWNNGCFTSVILNY